MSIYKDCDIRGIYPTEISEKDCYYVGRALASLCKGKKILVGGDVRLSTPMLKTAFIKGLLESGGQLVDLGMIPTPVLYYALSIGDAYAGATVTASHNPPEYNGIKFMIDHMPVTREIMEQIRESANDGRFISSKGSYEECDAIGQYLEYLGKRFRAKQRLHVLIDAGNGAMSCIAPEAFRRAGYAVTEFNCIPDGSFPNRSPNPADYRCLKQTGDAVRRCKADFGVAFDGDGDRAVFLDENGVPIQNEKTLVLFIRKLLKEKPTPVVYDQKSSSIVKNAVVEMKGTPLPEKSGHAFIKKRFLENNAAIAGEVSGHFFFGELGYDDGLFAALIMAELICEERKHLSKLVEKIQCPPITPDIRLYCKYEDQQEWLDRAYAMAKADCAEISCLDGIRADYRDKWFLIRKSVTGEQITLRAEAETEQELKTLLERLADVLSQGNNGIRSLILSQLSN